MRMFALTLSAAALALGAGTVVLAQPGAGSGPRAEQGPVTRAQAEERARQHFTRMDINNDGRIDAADREARQQQRFARLDTDGNGQISQDEYAAKRGKRGGDGQHAQRRGGKRDGAMMGRMGRMGGAAGNRDMTADDFVARALARFDRADADKDGTVTTEERRALRSAMRQQRQELRAQRQAPGN